MDYAFDNGTILHVFFEFVGGVSLIANANTTTAQTIYVGTNEGDEDGTQESPYNTVNEALNVANDGDVIKLLISVSSLPQTSKSVTFEGATSDIHITSTNENYLGGGSGSATVTYKNLICDNARAIAVWGGGQENVSYVFDNVSFSTLNDGTCVFVSSSTVKSITIKNCTFTTINNTAMWFINSVEEFSIENSTIDGADGFLKVRYADTSIIKLNNNTFKDCEDVVRIEGNATSQTELHMNNNTITNCENVITILDSASTIDDILKEFSGNTYNGLPYTDINTYPTPQSDEFPTGLVVALSVSVVVIIGVVISVIIIIKKKKSTRTY